MGDTNKVEIEVADSNVVPAEPLLMLPWKRFPFDFRGGEFTIGDHPLYIDEVPNSGLGTGLNVWDGSVVLAKYLEHKYPYTAAADVSRKQHQGQGGRPLAGSRVIELGAGTGVVGLAAAFLGAAEVVLTDLKYTLPNLEANIAANQDTLTLIQQQQQGEGDHMPHVISKDLDWYVPRSSAVQLDGFDYVLCSDVVWVEELIEPLVTTLEVITQPPPPPPPPPPTTTTTDAAESAAAAPPPPPPPVILFSYQSRSSAADVTLFARLAVAFDVHQLDASELHPDFTASNIAVYRITRRPGTAAAAAVVPPPASASGCASGGGGMASSSDVEEE